MGRPRGATGRRQWDCRVFSSITLARQRILHYFICRNIVWPQTRRVHLVPVDMRNCYNEQNVFHGFLLDQSLKTEKNWTSGFQRSDGAEVTVETVRILCWILSIGPKQNIKNVRNNKHSKSLRQNKHTHQHWWISSERGEVSGRAGERCSALRRPPAVTASVLPGRTRGPDTSVARRPDTLRPRPETRGAGFTAIATSQSRDELCVRIRYRNSSSQTWTSTGLLMASKRFVGFVWSQLTQRGCDLIPRTTLIHRIFTYIENNSWLLHVVVHLTFNVSSLCYHWSVCTVEVRSQMDPQTVVRLPVTSQRQTRP